MNQASLKWYHSLLIIPTLVCIIIFYLCLWPILMVIRYMVIGVLRYPEVVIWLIIVGIATYGAYTIPWHTLSG